MSSPNKTATEPQDPWEPKDIPDEPTAVTTQPGFDFTQAVIDLAIKDVTTAIAGYTGKDVGLTDVLWDLVGRSLGRTFELINAVERHTNVKPLIHISVWSELNEYTPIHLEMRPAHAVLHFHKTLGNLAVIDLVMLVVTWRANATLNTKV